MHAGILTSRQGPQGHATAASRELLGRRLAGWSLAILLVGTAPAAPGVFETCVDYHCDEKRPVSLRPDNWAALESLFRENGSAAAERASIRRGIAQMEQISGAQTGTWRDLAGNTAGAGQPGQLDCIAESINTTTYLQLFADAGLLHWHVVEAPTRRQRWLVNFHRSAVIRDRQTGQRYAVDSWYRDNGIEPVIQPLEDWLSGRTPSPVEDQ